MALTIEQQRAVARARARTRVQKTDTHAFEQPNDADLLLGSTGLRAAAGYISPLTGAVQLGAETVGFKGVSDFLKWFNDSQKRGMTPAADLIRLQRGREILSGKP